MRLVPVLVVVAVCSALGGSAAARDELLEDASPSETEAQAKPSAPARADELEAREDAPAAADATAAQHAAVFAENRYPSATACQSCHPDQYREWAMSQHSYSQISPTLQAMQARALQLTNVTNGDFCIRCHNPIGMNLGEPLYMSSMDRAPVSREGVTCVVCHRLSAAYGKVNGRMRIEEGPVHEPVKGPTGNAELKRVLADATVYDVTTDPTRPGRGIHADAVYFAQISTSAFCGTCHDVTAPAGLRIEDAFSEYKMSPAAARGTTCQDCHMSSDAGRPAGYRTGPAAVVGGVATRSRTRADHRFAGPDYSLIHPGLFPHNTKAQALATMREWIRFDWKAGWGTPAFEAAVPADAIFPPRWRLADDRIDARAVIDENLASLHEIEGERLKVLRAGFALDDIVPAPARGGGLGFSVRVRNAIDAHNVPTGFDAERVVYLRVTVTDAGGDVVFRSGDLDPNGDLRDGLSLYVGSGKVPLDEQLFTIRSKFLLKMIRGGDREQPVPTNRSASALIFFRPDTKSTIIAGHPELARKYRKTLAPLAERTAKYTVTAKELAGHPGPYVAKVELVVGMLAPHLVAGVQMAGFDYDMSPRAVGDALVAGYMTVWEKTATLQPTVLH